jgi:hypothetical protein
MKLLELLAEAAAPDDSGKPGWVNRRVEQLEFLDTRAVRWRTSIDFVVPPDSPRVRIGEQDARLIPVTTMPKRPLVDFDLLDEDEKAMCLPTSEETGAMIAPALIWVATFNLNRLSLPSGLDEDLRKIVTAGPGEYKEQYAPFAAAAAMIDVSQRRKDLYDVCWRERKKFTLRHIRAWYWDQWDWARDWAWAQKALADAEQNLWQSRRRLVCVAQCSNCPEHGLDGPPDATLKMVEPNECRRCAAYQLMDNPDVRNLVEVLARDFVVCVAVTSPPGTRRIIKLAFEQKISFWTHNGRWRRLGQGLGLVCWPFDTLIGGRGGSHHLEVAAPPGIDVVRITTQPAIRRGPGPLPRQVRGLSPHVHTLVPATPPIRYRATTLVRTSRQGWLTASLLVAVVIAVMMAFGTADLSVLFPPPVKGHSADSAVAGVAATLLLALLGVIAIWLVRPGEHPLASRLLEAVRILVLVDVVVVLVATGDLVLHKTTLQPPDALWLVLAWVSGAVAFLMILAWVFPLVLPGNWGMRVRSRMLSLMRGGAR